MIAKKVNSIACMLSATTLGVAGIWATLLSAAPAAKSLSPAGERLQARYAEMTIRLKEEITAALPKLEEKKKGDLLKAYHDEAGAAAAENKALLAQGGKQGKNIQPGGPTLEAAKEALALAKKNASSPAKLVLAKLEPFLASDQLDVKLTKCVVLIESTPRGLAEFAQAGKEQESLVDKLLADTGLLKEMLIAGGAKDGKYGEAMQIYTAIQSASPESADGPLQRLALATALELAVPIAQSNPQGETNAPATVDPVKRYLHFQKAWLDGELDPEFKNLTTWDYRNVVNGDEPDHILAWGRAMLWNYRPDHIYTPDFRWRYVAAVKTDVKYGSQEVQNDRPTLQSYQNIIANGGVCGRRAFFGRFILRAFGIPTVARPQPGHATLCHWTPDGWVINLGATWGWGQIGRQCDIDFLAMTQARKMGSAYLKVLRAQWIADVAGEARAFGFYSPASGFWNGVALYRQAAIIDAAKAVALEAVGRDIGEANVSKEKEVTVKAVVTDVDRKVVVGSNGTITIPAVACSKPTADTKAIQFLKSRTGGLQLHYNRLGGEEAFEYTFAAPHAGKYSLMAQVVTVAPNQAVEVSPNDSKEPITLAMPYTVGQWQTAGPIEITLAKGNNVLRLTRKGATRGLTIKEFKLVPVQ